MHECILTLLDSTTDDFPSWNIEQTRTRVIAGIRSGLPNEQVMNEVKLQSAMVAL